MKYVIGDIHGEITKLEKLIDFIRSSDVSPEFIFIGDYLDKGENSLETLRFLNGLKAKHACTFLIGNHEYFWKSIPTSAKTAVPFLEKYGGVATQQDLGLETIQSTYGSLMKEFGSFFESLQLFWENEKYLVTHSGLAPSGFSSDIAGLKAEDLLFNRFNFLGQNKTYRGKKIIFGHTAFFDVFYDGFKVGVDTGACYSLAQPLTAFCVDSDRFFQSHSKVFDLSSLSKEVCPSIIRTKSYRKSRTEHGAPHDQ